jgi:hypothetical protein
MNKIYALLLITCSLLSCKQVDKKNNIPGTKIFIEVPKDFKFSKNIIGLEKNNNALIQVSDLVGGNYYSNANSFSKQAFEEKGAKVFEYEEFELDGYPAKYIYMQTQPDQKGMYIVFGDSTFCDMVMAVFPPNDKTIADQIKESLFSIEYNKQLKVDHLALAFFKVNENNSKFKFAKASANMFTYSKGGIIKSSYENEPMFLITPFPADATITKEQISESMLNGLIQNGLVVIEEKNIKTERVNGYDAYEIEVYGYLKAKKVLFYMLVLVKENKAIGMQGITYSNFDNELIEFKEIAKKVVFK